MSPFIRRYARYLNEKALSYRTVAFDFCKVKRGSVYIFPFITIDQNCFKGSFIVITCLIHAKIFP